MNAVLIIANCYLWCNVLVMRCRKIYLPLQVRTQNAISGQVVLQYFSERYLFICYYRYCE